MNAPCAWLLAAIQVKPENRIPDLIKNVPMHCFVDDSILVNIAPFLESSHLFHA